LSGNLGDAVWERVAAGLSEPTLQSERAAGLTSTGPATSAFAGWPARLPGGQCLEFVAVQIAYACVKRCRFASIQLVVVAVLGHVLVRETSTPGRRKDAARSSLFIVPSVCPPCGAKETNSTGTGQVPARKDRMDVLAIWQS
jgi:hypothetical protein